MREIIDALDGHLTDAEVNMAENAKSKIAEYESTPAPVALIDVLIRGLETAKQRMEGDGDVIPRRFCALFYLDSDHSCLVGYYRPE